jgi:hypothetical protein
MQDAFGIVIFAVVGISAVIAVISLFGRGRMYDDIGRGGLSIGEDRDMRPRRTGAAASTPVNRAERDDEIRQMLEARNARRAARGEPPADVDAELQALTAPDDPGLREEVRTLVEATNARRAARGEPPLDVEAEIDRRLSGL